MAGSDDVNIFNYPQEVLPCPSLNNEIFTKFAFQYGSSLVDSGKQIIHHEIDKYFPLSKLRYFFAVDSSYVKFKLFIVLFPFCHNDWSVKCMKNVRFVPKLDVNAPDLYIPLMAYLTYLFVSGLLLGLMNTFSPENLVSIASQGFIWTSIEISLQVITLYFIPSAPRFSVFELMAYSGYKFIPIISCILLRMFSNQTVYIVSAGYFSFSSFYFIVNSLKSRLLLEPQEILHSELPQSPASRILEYKRKLYFILTSGISHFFHIWWLSYYPIILKTNSS